MTDILNTYLAAASVALDALFDGTLPVYGEEVPDELPERCILLSLEDVQWRKAFGRRYEVSATLDVAYYMPLMTLDRDRELNEVYARCCAGFGLIEYDGHKLALHTMRRSDQSGVLHIKCPFQTHLYSVPDDPIMGKIKNTGGTK